MGKHPFDPIKLPENPPHTVTVPRKLETIAILEQARVHWMGVGDAADYFAVSAIHFISDDLMQLEFRLANAAERSLAMRSNLQVVSSSDND